MRGSTRKLVQGSHTHKPPFRAIKSDKQMLQYSTGSPDQSSSLGNAFWFVGYLRPDSRFAQPISDVWVKEDILRQVLGEYSLRTREEIEDK